jgi:hypothetical protein
VLLAPGYVRGHQSFVCQSQLGGCAKAVLWWGLEVFRQDIGNKQI